jgi:hypothetical protein
MIARRNFTVENWASMRNNAFIFSQTGSMNGVHPCAKLTFDLNI